MTIEPYLLAVALVSFALSLGCFIGFVFILIRVYNLDVELHAIQKSTHKIQWMPVDQAWAAQEKALNKAFEDFQGHPSDLEGI